MSKASKPAGHLVRPANDRNADSAVLGSGYSGILTSLDVADPYHLQYLAQVMRQTPGLISDHYGETVQVDDYVIHTTRWTRPDDGITVDAARIILILADGTLLEETGNQVRRHETRLLAWWRANGTLEHSELPLTPPIRCPPARSDHGNPLGERAF